MRSCGGGFWQVEELSESVIGFKAMWALLPVGELKSITLLSTMLDSGKSEQSGARQQFGIATFSRGGLELQWAAILIWAASATAGATAIARTAMITPARIDFNELVRIYY